MGNKITLNNLLNRHKWLVIIIFLVVMPRMALSSDRCAAVLAGGIYDEYSFLSLEHIEEVTRQASCSAKNNNFSYSYSGVDLGYKTISDRCQSNYNKVVHDSQASENLRTVNRAILASWDSCIKTKEGLKHWLTTIDKAPTKFHYSLYFDVVGDPDKVKVNVNMQPKNVWESCTYKDGSTVKNPINVGDQSVILTCSRDPRDVVTITVLATSNVPDQINLPAYIDTYVLRTSRADDYSYCTITTADTNNKHYVGEGALLNNFFANGINKLNCIAEDRQQDNLGNRCYGADFELEVNGYKSRPWGKIPSCCGSSCGKGVPFKFFDETFNIKWPSPSKK